MSKEPSLKFLMDDAAGLTNEKSDAAALYKILAVSKFYYKSQE